MVAGHGCRYRGSSRPLYKLSNGTEQATKGQDAPLDAATEAVIKTSLRFHTAFSRTRASGQEGCVLKVGGSSSSIVHIGS